MSRDPVVEVRCQNPKCTAKLAEHLEGRLVIICRKCGLRQTIERKAT